LFGASFVVFFLAKIGRVAPARGRILQLLLMVLPVFWYFRNVTVIRIGSYIIQKPSQLTEKAAALNILIDSLGIVLFSFAGFQVFLRFINTEGSAFIRAQAELAAAHAIQHTLVPALSRRSATLEILGRSLPSDKVGGDIVDSVDTGTGTIAYLADVSGHGLPAGILMGMLKTALRATLDSPDVASALLRVNRILPAVKEPQMYATFACLSYPSEAPRQIQYCVAGHLPILHFSHATSSVSRLTMEQFPLGLLPVSSYETGSAACGAGDVFAILSDGIVEVEDTGGHDFGLARAEGILREKGTEALSNIHDAVMANVASFGKQEDDQSLLLIRILS
jgi:serine phosphatase RsbU (regulator of sigma subunit)